MTTLSRVVLLAALLHAVVACSPAPDSLVTAAPVDGFATEGHLTSKMPYLPLQAAGDYTDVPAGFSLWQLQLVARHGARALSGPGDDELSLALWRQAADENALTALGRLLGPVLEALRQANVEVGYGAISALGEREQQDLAARLLLRHPDFADALRTAGRPIAVLHSGRERADQSADAFVAGLLQQAPHLASLVAPPRAVPATLYFHSAEGSPDYERYRKDDARLAATLTALAALPETPRMARQLLAPLYTEAFIDSLEAGRYQWAAPSDPEETLDSLLDAAQLLYGLYSVASNLADEGDWQFGRFMEPEATAWLAFLDDAETFYERGPGFADEDVSYRAAVALLDDFFLGIDAALHDPAGVGMALRFTHAQALIPFAVLLGIEGSFEPLPEGVLYSYRSSGWRSERTAPMSANIQWEVYRNAGGEVIVRMLHQEAEVRFKTECSPYAAASFFYALDELRRCYERAQPIGPAA